MTLKSRGPPKVTLKSSPESDFLDRKGDACKIKENDVPRKGVAIANHCAIANLLRIVNLLSRFHGVTVFSGFGWFFRVFSGCF